LQRSNGQWLGPAPSRRYARPMCGGVRLSSDVSEIKLVFFDPAAPADAQQHGAVLERGADRSAANGFVGRINRMSAGPPSDADEVME
jgi:hypothetical protein